MLFLKYCGCYMDQQHVYGMPQPHFYNSQNPIWGNIIPKFIIHSVMLKKITIEAIGLMLCYTIFQPIKVLIPLWLEASSISIWGESATSWLSCTHSYISKSNIISNVGGKTIKWNARSEERRVGKECRL